MSHSGTQQLTGNWTSNYIVAYCYKIIETNFDTVLIKLDHSIHCLNATAYGANAGNEVTD